MTPTPKPCPFCNFKPLASDHRWVDWVECACGAEGPYAETRRKSIEKWNYRPIEDALREALKPFAEFAEQWDARPPGGSAKRDDDIVYSIHLIPGAPPASITLGHLRAAARVLKKEETGG